MKTSLGVRRGLIVIGMLAVFALPVWAEVRLPRVIGDHMVLQQRMPVPIWGWADPGETVNVSFHGETVACTADGEGQWQVELPKLKVNAEPSTMTIQGASNAIELENILVGEVWVASGQSNMQWTVANSNNAEAEIAAADLPLVRLFQTPLVTADAPQDDCEGTWSVCTPESVPNFSAVAFFFGRELHEHLDVPIGLIQTAWGGTPVESWTSRPSLESEPIARPLLERWEEIIAEWPETEKAFAKRIEAWEEACAKAKADGKKPPRQPWPPHGPDHPHRPSSLYNAMIAPLVPYGIQGAIWYQGESNADRAFQYRTLFPLMIEDWRMAWGQGEFPFLFVQLANWQQHKPEPGDDAWAELREAQCMALDLPNTGMAVAIDIGEADDIHPKNKQDVGKRLARNAYKIAYGENVAYTGPIFRRMKIKDGKAVLTFKNVEGGLHVLGGDALEGFAVAGADKQFVWAKAELDGRRKVVVWNDDVPEPVAVRYAWAINPVCNLYDGAGLPASPFRTDDWPCITKDKLAP